MERVLNTLSKIYIEVNKLFANIDFNNSNNFKKIAECESFEFVEGFLEDKTFAVESKIDYNVDDMIPYSLVLSNGKKYIIIPDGNCCADIYQILNDETFKIIKEEIDNFKEE